MRARDVVGARIVGVEQERIYDHGSGLTFFALTAIRLDNGRTIVLSPRPYTAAGDDGVWCDDAVDADVVTRR